MAEQLFCRSKEFDAEKNETNIEKHKISFADIDDQSFNPTSIDEVLREVEIRYVCYGWYSGPHGLINCDLAAIPIVVVTCFREPRVRLISARRMKTTEIEKYL